MDEGTIILKVQLWLKTATTSRSEGYVEMMWEDQTLMMTPLLFSRQSIDGLLLCVRF